MKELGASPEESEQVSTMMKERVKLRKAKEAEMIEKSTVQLGEQKDELEVCVYVHHVTVRRYCYMWSVCCVRVFCL